MFASAGPLQGVQVHIRLTLRLCAGGGLFTFLQQVQHGTVDVRSFRQSMKSRKTAVEVQSVYRVMALHGIELQ